MANDNKLRDTVTRATAMVGVKTSVFVGSAKVRTQIGTIKRDIDNLTTGLGNLVYELWKNGETNSEQIATECQAINEKHAAIITLNEEIIKLEKQESDVLGTKKQETFVSTPAEERFKCPNADCGATYNSQIKFCRKCGSKMI